MRISDWSSDVCSSDLIPDDAHCVVTDVTAGEAVLAVMGPHSRDLLAQASPDDLTDAAFPFSTAREIEVGAALARAHRLSYVGELGWELYVPADMARHVFDRLMEAGAPLEIGRAHV